VGFDAAMNSYFEKLDPEKNLARFYSLTILPNLFGEWSLQREWGRIGRRPDAHCLLPNPRPSAPCLDPHQDRQDQTRLSDHSPAAFLVLILNTKIRFAKRKSSGWGSTPEPPKIPSGGVCLLCQSEV